MPRRGGIRGILAPSSSAPDLSHGRLTKPSDGAPETGGGLFKHAGLRVLDNVRKHNRLNIKRDEVSDVREAQERMSRFRAFQRESMDPDEFSETTRDFFGPRFFTEQQNIFPEWMKERADFRTCFPRFCSDADEFRVLEDRIQPRERVLKVLLQSSLGSDLDRGVLQGLAKRAVFRTVKKGDTLYIPGDELPYVIIICSGQVSLTPLGFSSANKTVGVGSVLGEEQIVSKGTGLPMLETAVALTSGKIAFIDAHLFREEIRVPQMARVAELENWIVNGGCPEISKLSAKRAAYIGKAAVLRLLKEGEEVYRPGEVANAAFCVRHGYVRVGSKRYGPGSLFGLDAAADYRTDEKLAQIHERHQHRGDLRRKDLRRGGLTRMITEGKGAMIIRNEGAVALKGGADLAVLEREALMLVADLEECGEPIVQWKPALTREEYRQIYHDKYGIRHGFTASPPPPPTPPVPVERLRVDAVTKFREQLPKIPVSNSPRVDELRRMVLEESPPKVWTPPQRLASLSSPAFDVDVDVEPPRTADDSRSPQSSLRPRDSETGTAVDIQSDMATSLSNFGDFLNRTAGSWSFKNPGEVAADAEAEALEPAEAATADALDPRLGLSDLDGMPLGTVEVESVRGTEKGEGDDAEKEDDLFARAAASLTEGDL